MAAFSEADKARVVSDMIRRAPAGQFTEVLEDVRAIVQNDQLLQDKAISAYISYDEEWYTPVTFSDGHKSLITKFGRMGLGLYLDPATNTLFKFDHVKKEASDTRPHERTALFELTEAYRRHYELHVRDYVAEYFPHGNFAVYVKNIQSEDEVIVCIEDHTFSLGNCYTGIWRSTWRLSPRSGKGTGSMALAFHYFEDGNIQMSSKRDIDIEVAVGDAEEMAARLARTIRREETLFQTLQVENFDAMSASTFKGLRRALPSTKVKMDWNQLVLYELGKKLASR